MEQHGLIDPTIISPNNKECNRDCIASIFAETKLKRKAGSVRKNGFEFGQIGKWSIVVKPQKKAEIWGPFRH